MKTTCRQHIKTCSTLSTNSTILSVGKWIRSGRPFPFWTTTYNINAMRVWHPRHSPHTQSNKTSSILRQLRYTQFHIAMHVCMLKVKINRLSMACECRMYFCMRCTCSNWVPCNFHASIGNSRKNENLVTAAGGCCYCCSSYPYPSTSVTRGKGRGPQVPPPLYRFSQSGPWSTTNINNIYS